jgi:hypothetical protein
VGGEYSIKALASQLIADHSELRQYLIEINRLALLNLCVLKPNSWTYNYFFEVSGHYFESSDLRFLRGFLKPYGKVLGFLSDFPPSSLQCTVTHCRNWKRLREFEEIEIPRQRRRGDFEYQGGKLLRLLPGFRLRIRPQYRGRAST